MNKMILTGMLLFLCGTVMQSQVKIGSNSAPANGALLDLNGAYKGGLLLPNVSILDLDTIPAEFTEKGGENTAPELTGLIVWSYNFVNSGLYMWDGNKWQSLMCEDDSTSCSAPAPAPTAINIPTGPFAYGETFTVSCTAVKDGTTFFTWTVPPGLSIINGQGTEEITVSGTNGTYNKNQFKVLAENLCGKNDPVTGGGGTIVVKAALSTTPPPASIIYNANFGSLTLPDTIAGTVTGGNCGSYSYQWQKLVDYNWEDIPDANLQGYTTDFLSVDTQYRRITTCGSESVTSGIITVEIYLLHEPESVSAYPTTICVGAPVTLSSTGGQGTTFVWYTGSCGGTRVGTGKTLVVSPTTTTTYYGRWERNSNQTECKQVTVTVTPTNLPTVAITANNTSISVNTEVTFTATASYGVSYQWFVDNVLQNGQNGSTFKTSWSSAKIYQVYCRVVNNGGCGATSSNIISVTVNAVLGKDCDGCKRRLELAQISKSEYPYYAVAEGFCIASYLNSYGYGGISFRMTDTGLKDGTYFQKGQKWKSGGCTGKYYYEFGNR